MAIYLVEEKVWNNLNCFDQTYKWNPKIRCTNKEIAFEKMNELLSNQEAKTENEYKQYRVVRLLS